MLASSKARTGYGLKQSGISVRRSGYGLKAEQKDLVNSVML
jgi:hypothetical protein